MENYSIEIVKQHREVSSEYVYVFNISLEFDDNNKLNYRLSDIRTGLEMKLDKTKELDTKKFITTVNKFLLKYDIYPHTMIVITDQSNKIIKYLLTDLKYCACYLDQFCENNIRTLTDDFELVDARTHKRLLQPSDKENGKQIIDKVNGIIKVDTLFNYTIMGTERFIVTGRERINCYDFKVDHNKLEYLDDMKIYASLDSMMPDIMDLFNEYK